MLEGVRERVLFTWVVLARNKPIEEGTLEDQNNAPKPGVIRQESLSKSVSMEVVCPCSAM